MFTRYIGSSRLPVVFCIYRSVTSNGEEGGAIRCRARGCAQCMCMCTQVCVACVCTQSTRVLAGWLTQVYDDQEDTYSCAYAQVYMCVCVETLVCGSVFLAHKCAYIYRLDFGSTKSRRSCEIEHSRRHLIGRSHSPIMHQRRRRSSSVQTSGLDAVQRQRSPVLENHRLILAW